MYTELRNYVVDTIDKMQDGWKIETRIRTSGKQCGNPYKVYKQPLTGLNFWSVAAAVQAGFDAGGVTDGRKAKGKTTAAKPLDAPPEGES